MAKVELLTPKILKYEGGYVNDPDDAGGATNMGITLNTWKQVGYDKNKDGRINESDIKMLSVADVTMVLKKYYWDKWHADDIHSQSIAELLVDWLWSSGYYGIKIPQKALGLNPDGVVGPKTLALINGYSNQKELFERLKTSRLAYIDGIIKRNPKQKKFEKGWKGRINSFLFVS